MFFMVRVPSHKWSSFPKFLGAQVRAIRFKSSPPGLTPRSSVGFPLLSLPEVKVHVRRVVFHSLQNIQGLHPGQRLRQVAHRTPTAIA